MESNISRFLEFNVAHYGEYEQFIYLGPEGEKRLKNTDLLDQARRLSTGLRKMGVQKGDIIGTVVSNLPETPVLINGINRCGAVYLPIIFMLTAKEIRYILEDSRCKFVLVEDKLLPKVREAADGVKTVETIIVIGQERGAGLLPYDDLMTKGDELGDVVPVEADDLSILMYTSGTTGFPKGVMLSHRNMEKQMMTGSQVWGGKKGEIMLTTVPMNHIFGVISTLELYHLGCVSLLMPPFDPRKVLDAIRDYRVSFIPVVPTMLIFLMMVFDPAKDDTSSLDLLICSGGPLALDTLENAQKTFKIEITQGYGCTEVGGSMTRQRRDWPRKPGSVGFPMPGLALRVVNADGKDVPRGEEGEVICKGPIVMKGYLNKPEETSAALVNGWLHTGDIGKLDEDGELYITGRLKDLIIKGGENIDPGVAEGWLYKHPAIWECAVVAVKDPNYGEDVAAAVTLKPGQQATEEELLTYLGEHLHHFVAPKKIFFLDAMPKTGLGKILKREIRRIINEK